MHLELGATSRSKMEKLVGFLRRKELEFTTKGIAMTSYNASIARVLEKGGVDKFEEFAWEAAQQLGGVECVEDFDRFHGNFVGEIMRTLRTNEKTGSKPLSYGQGQKPVNVFLKAYVDKAGLPEAKLAEKLRPFLHVPLDSEMMEYFCEEFPNEYGAFVRPVIDKYQQAGKRHGYNFRLSDREFLALHQILDEDHYYAWQNLFRRLYPEKPVLLDTVYSLRTRGEEIRL